MIISYRYPIFPDKATQQKLAEALDACRWLYNKLLGRMNEARENGIKLRTYETQKMIPSLKLENSKLKQHRKPGCSEKNGYDVGPLRFKGYGWYKTLNYNQSSFKLDQDHGRLHLFQFQRELKESQISIWDISKIGDIRIKLYRKVKGCIKAIIIKREGRQWYAIVQADQEPEPLPRTGRSVGLDVGLTSFVVDSDGNSTENPRYAEKSARKLARYQRKLGQM